jgi:preprotein translocase subunit SecF
MSGLASRLYRGEAGLRVVQRRKVWFTIAACIVVVAIASFIVRGFALGIEFKGGTEFQMPASVGTLKETEDRTNAILGEVAGAEVATAQDVRGLRGGESTYLLRTGSLTAAQSAAVKSRLAAEFNVPVSEISDSRVSPAWGGAVTERAIYALLIFLAVVLLYLVLRFEWRMAVAAVAALILDLILTAMVYSLVGFEVTPSTIIGFLTILGFALYDVVVVFDKIQENTRGITAGSSQTYGEAANLALNQTLMRSINTSAVALLPVGGLLFIGAGLLGAGTLKDLGLVLFVGMAAAFFASIFFATPVLVVLKDQEPRIKAHNQRVLARRAAARSGAAPAKDKDNRAPAAAGGSPTGEEVSALAGSAAPRVGARPEGKRNTGSRNTGRGGRPGGAGNRPKGSKRR